MTVLGAMVQVEAQVEPVVGRQRDIVGALVDEVATDIVITIGAGHRGKRHQLCGQRHAVAGVQRPCSIHLCLLRQVQARGEVQLVAVVELVVEPAVVEVVELALVPRQRVGSLHLHLLVLILRLGLNAVEAAATVHHLRVPRGCGRLQTCPAVELQQVARQLVVALQRQHPLLGGLHVGTYRPLVGVHGPCILRGGHPVVGGQVEERVADFVHILRHHGVAGLQRQVGAQLVFHGQTRVNRTVGLSAGNKERHVYTTIHAPTVGERQLVLGIDVQLVARLAVAAAVAQGVANVGACIEEFLLCLRTELVIGVVVAEADVMTGRGTVVELRTVADVVDDRVCGMFVVIDVQIVGRAIAPVAAGADVSTVVGIDGCEVGHQLRGQRQVPVEGSVQVAPAQVALQLVNVYTVIFPVVTFVF